MKLENDIKQQYSDRLNKAGLYNSTYSKLAAEERIFKSEQLIKKHLGKVESRTVLEIGAGQGDNVALLNYCGFKDEHIYLNELLPERVAAIKNNYPKVNLYPGNALDLNFNEKYDCVFQSTVFTSVLNDSDRILLANKMWALLKPGGIILWYDFVYDNPNNSNVRKVDINQLKELFPNPTLIEILKITLAPPIGRRVGALYHIFNLPFLRSHILAVFKKQ